MPMVKVLASQVADSAACAVCQEEYTESETVAELPCHHLFHKACIVPWLKSSNSCPSRA
ncbi:uncharacterized protein AMSG_01842 [Thecamonas trahens ATCC 50062]|uniref:RING-type domain-containing protein n=1 Tax=Thecamonas trahens ATCC 50062 TaxID=461836 RepID=A0A0L0DTQ3_THETB|nr:hypothetical protein AMSG_01842 [Thecamonas trahens ATCC 50062]KNC55577.1 hypothetical protein AMSG_01842 [Thecamonas trahens ATCC 50062]|eukprot:XP_013761351.1 hypothetical protein AMSG_01842 [Thecamonas trahens ATCC 50062]